MQPRRLNSVAVRPNSEEKIYPSSVGILPEGEERVRHRLQVPNAVGRLLECVKPLAMELGWNGPAQALAAHAHADEMAPLVRALTVDECFTAMKDG